MNLVKSKRFFSGKRGEIMSVTLILFLSSILNFLAAQVTVTISKVDPTCSGFTNGSATATATGGTAPYTYRWSNNVTGSSIFGLGSGTFSVAATDAAGRTGTASVTFVNPTPITASISFANICNGGSVTATAAGGTGPYTYNWGGGRTGATQTGIAGGSYNLTVTDSKGCSSVKFVSVPAAFSVSLRVGALQCFGDCDAAVDALTSGGTAPFTYRWNTGATTQAIVGLPTGTYSVTVTDANGCTGSASGTVLNPPQIVISTSVNAPACGSGGSGSASVSATGGRPPFTYKWSNGQTGTTATGLSVGDYFVTVMDAGGCNRTAKVVVPSNAGFTIGINKTDASCGANNGSATASVTSGGRAPFTYKWNTNATTAAITNIGAGTYTVTVTDANGCVNTASTTINAAGNLNINVTSTNAACGIANGTATATPTSGTAPFTYKWSNNATTASISLLSAGTYTVTVTDASGCTAIGSATITTGNSIAVTVDLVKNVTCFGQNDGQLTAMVSGGSAPYTYRWSNGGNIAVLANLAAGSYTVTVTDAAGCTGTASNSITQPTALNIATTVSSTSCGTSNGSSTATVTGGTSPYTYAWSNNSTSSSISNLAAGSYTLTVTDAKGCKANATVTITSSNGISLSTGATHVTCNGGTNGSASATVTGATGTVTYAWSNGGNTATINNLAAGTYTVTATNGGCSATSSVTINQPTAIAISISLTNPTCGSNNGSLTAAASGGTPQYSYRWSNGSTTASISGLASGTYTVTVTDANGCTKMTSQAISAPNAPVLTMNQTNVSCFGGSNGSASVSVTGGTAPYTYNWGSSRTTASITGLNAGTYTVTVTDNAGCTASGSVTVTQPNAISLTSTVTSATCVTTGSAEVTVTGGTGPYSYLWNNGGTTAKISNVAAGNYTVTVTDAKGCTSSLTVTVPSATSPNLRCSITITKQMTGNNTNDAEVRVDATGGSTPYTYRWNTLATTQTLTGLRAGHYTVTVTDANGCTTFCFVDIVTNCNNVTNAGTICCNQTFCSATEIQPINETTPASGGSNVDPIQYLWMYNEVSDVFDPSTWIPIPGATGANLPVNLMPTISRPVHFARCVRRGVCDYKESNIITLTPRAFAVINGPTTACLNQDVLLSAEENAVGATYLWTFSGANITTSGGRTPTVRYNSTGFKQVILTVTVFGCQKSQVMSINVTNCQGAYGGIMGFNANPVQQKEVMLDWATSNEQTPSKYLVEKSLDGITFTTIGTVASQNQNNNLYRFADVEPKMGRSFYRIRQITMDDTNVNVTQAKKVVMGQNGVSVLTYPNPAQSSIFVEVLDTDNAEGTIEIYNHIGRLVQTQQFTKDQLRYQINTENLASGTYILKIRRADGNIQSVKITKL